MMLVGTNASHILPFPVDGRHVPGVGTFLSWPPLRKYPLRQAGHKRSAPTLRRQPRYERSECLDYIGRVWLCSKAKRQLSTAAHAGNDGFDLIAAAKKPVSHGRVFV